MRIWIVVVLVLIGIVVSTMFGDSDPPRNRKHVDEIGPAFDVETLFIGSARELPEDLRARFSREVWLSAELDKNEEAPILFLEYRLRYDGEARPGLYQSFIPEFFYEGHYLVLKSDGDGNLTDENLYSQSLTLWSLEHARTSGHRPVSNLRPSANPPPPAPPGTVAVELSVKPRDLPRTTLLHFVEFQGSGL